jgi:hypothetical protein
MTRGQIFDHLKQKDAVVKRGGGHAPNPDVPGTTGPSSI